MVKKQRASASTSQKIGQRIKELRKARDLTQVSLAEECGIDSITISRMERGERSPTLEQLEKMAAFFQVPITTFFDVDVSDANASDAVGLSLLKQLSPEQQQMAIEFLRVYVRLHGRRN